MFYIYIICRYIFRLLLAILRRKYTIIILGSYFNFNGSVGFCWVLLIVDVVVAYLVCVCELFK
jgi:hypothetical protein